MRHVRKLRAGVALAILAGGVFTSVALAAVSTFNTDFENGSISPWATSGNKPVVSKDFARKGSYAMKTVLDRAKSPTSFRTEVTSGGIFKTVAGGEYWYGFSIYLPTSYVSDPIWEIVAQWHNAPDINL